MDARDPYRTESALERQLRDIAQQQRLIEAELKKAMRRAPPHVARQINGQPRLRPSVFTPAETLAGTAADMQSGVGVAAPPPPASPVPSLQRLQAWRQGAPDGQRRFEQYFGGAGLMTGGGPSRAYDPKLRNKAIFLLLFALLLGVMVYKLIF